MDKTLSDPQLFELLRQKRNQRARELGVKPFMILHNKTLQEISRLRPTTVDDLLKIKGIGQKRVKKHGQMLLETVSNSNIVPKAEKKSQEKILSVSEFIRSLNALLTPKKAVVLGEVTQVNPYPDYLFFNLKDKKEEAVLNCFARRHQLTNSGIDIKEGLEIKVSGFPKIYERSGKLTFEVEHIGLVGEGALKQAFAKLKSKLEQLGYFAAERKKPLPEFVTSVGLITSQFGDAKIDFLEHLGKFGLQVYFKDVRVEGLYAIEEIVSAIRWFNENMTEVEVLGLTRGGGSLESLQTFNSEAVAKAIFGSKIPVITGIGHENDETIADLVADSYASTPTHAARMLSDPWRAAAISISNYQDNILSIFDGCCASIKSQLSSFENVFVLGVRRFLISEDRKLNYLQTELNGLFREILERVRKIERSFLANFEKLERRLFVRKSKIDSQEALFWREVEGWLKGLDGLLLEYNQKLRLVDPNLRLKQGYSVVFNAAHKVIKSAKQLKVGERINLKFHEGSASSRVEEIEL